MTNLILIVVLCLIAQGLSFRGGRNPSKFTGVSAVIRKSNLITRMSMEVEDAQVEEEDGAMVFTENALKHIEFLKSKQKEADADVILRMGVRAGGCSGMSYVMDFIKGEDVTEDDHEETIMDLAGNPLAKMVIDPKSLMYLFSMQLDYSDELIGGGFKFNNPNAETSCGCGKSFGV